ncbi:MAG: hypothetical protein KAG18_05075, partial [Sinobacterium sp.]|nr:hypothetical protein [Sinobacterium sp.]
MPSLPKIIANSLHYLLSVSFALLTAYTVNSTLESERRLRLELEQESTFEAALVLRSELELKLANTRLIPFTLRSQLRQKTAPNHRYFAELASDFISQSAFIRSIALIEDNVVVDIFPQAYGRIDLGDTFIQGKPNNKDFFIAKSQRETVISAPYIAQQDIMVIDLLTPLFLNSAYWG